MTPVRRRRDRAMQVDERRDVLRAVPSPAAVGGDSEVVHEALRRDDARLRACDAVLEVEDAQVQLGLGSQLQLSERLEEADVDVIALHGEVDPVERTAEAQGERVRDLDERLRVERALLVVALVPVAEVVAELDVTRHAAPQPHEALDDARPRVGEPCGHDAVEHRELEVRVPLHGELVVGDRVEDRRELVEHRRLVERLDPGLVFRCDERGDRCERRRQRHLEPAVRRNQSVALAPSKGAVRRRRGLRVAELLEAQRVDRLVVANRKRGARDANPRPAGTPRTPGVAEHRVLPHNPVRPWAGLAVGHSVEPFAEFRCHELEHLVGTAQRHAADQQHAAGRSSVGVGPVAFCPLAMVRASRRLVGRRSRRAQPVSGRTSVSDSPPNPPAAAFRSSRTRPFQCLVSMRAWRSRCEHISG